MTALQKIAISNLAWPGAADQEAITLAGELGFAGIELAPMKIFPAWDDAMLAPARDYRARLADRGLTVPAMQGIAFGTQGCELFASDASRAKLARHFALVARLAGVVGAHACVFGAPKLRDPGSHPPERAFAIAAAFLRDVAPVFESEGTALALEANPTSYGCRFITRTAEAIELVEAVARPGIRLQLDLGTIAVNDEPLSIIADAAASAAHLHVSEPSLDAVGAGSRDHRPLARAIAASDYRGWLSVEMRETPDWRSAVRTAGNLMAEIYA